MSTVTVSLPARRADQEPRSRRVALSTMGCKVNLFESQVISTALRSADWQPVPADAEADLYVINTCTVTAEADRQARQLVRRAVRRNPDAIVVVTGCYAQVDPEACARIPGVDLVLGNDRKLDLHSLLPRLERGELPQVLVGEQDQQITIPDQLVTGFESHTRAFVQVQQGCDQSCTYCIIHVARGPHRSLPVTLIRRQVERLVLNGYREVVLCGVDVGSYGADLAAAGQQRISLGTLLRELLALPGDFRLRISSIDPAQIDDSLIELMASNSRLCPHLHLSIQSGNTLILKRMKRRYDAQRVYDTVASLRRAIPGLTLGADLMAGFPTENDQAFDDTLAMVEDLDIAFPHVFTYSNRPGTPAARIPRQVPGGVRRQRAQRLREAGQRVLERHLARRRGSKAVVLVEGPAPGLQGYLRARDADYTTAWVPGGAARPGEWLPVWLEQPLRGGLIARPVANR